jgi:hypothetical protein
VRSTFLSRLGVFDSAVEIDATGISDAEAVVIAEAIARLPEA